MKYMMLVLLAVAVLVVLIIWGLVRLARAIFRRVISSK